MTISVNAAHTAHTAHTSQTSHQVLRNVAVLGLSLTLTVAVMAGLAAVVSSWA
jgi:hypothetical protein